MRCTPALYSFHVIPKNPGGKQLYQNNRLCAILSAVFNTRVAVGYDGGQLFTGLLGGREWYPLRGFSEGQRVRNIYRGSEN